jgi:hypothetical protein
MPAWPFWVVAGIVALLMGFGAGIAVDGTCDAQESGGGELCPDHSWQWAVIFGPLAAIVVVGLIGAATPYRNRWRLSAAVGAAGLVWVLAQDQATNGLQPF